VRVATYNIRHGAPEGRGADSTAMAAAVASLDADVVALQEVDRHVVRSYFVDQARVAAQRNAATAHFAPVRCMGPGGTYGNALLVRGRTLTRRDMTLPSRGEPRGAVFARVAIGDTELTVVATHLQNRRRGQSSEAPDQLAHLFDELARWPEPWCVMGDLNLRSDTVVPMAGTAGLTAVEAGATFPAHSPRLDLDWILLRGLSVASVDVPDLRTSDHRPVVVGL